MDETLYEHLNRLKTIDDRIDQIMRRRAGIPAEVREDLAGLRVDVAKFIEDAEADYLAF